jgi:glycosyltransferase involved in cell wall biosynthesis
MTEGPLVSVVLPTYNRAPWVGRAIASVLDQTHERLELIVVDDGSTDETPDVLARFGSRITVLSQPHSGAYAARNLGVRHAAGELIAFIDSDDAWHPDRLSSQLPAMERPEVGLVYGDARRLRPSGHGDAGGRRTCFAAVPPRRGRVADGFAWANFVPTLTVLVRRSCLEAVDGFPESHDVSADYLTWFRIAAIAEIDYVDRVIADYTVHDAGISQDLGHSLEARIGLFSAELRRSGDPAERAVLERLLFNLGLHLALAVVRGRAGSVTRPLGLARIAVRSAASRRTAAWTTAFFLRQARVRSRRRLRAAPA